MTSRKSTKEKSKERQDNRLDDKMPYEKVRSTHSQKTHINNETPKRLFSNFIDMKVYLVDGLYVRNHLDIDFVMGGNGARYSYVPEGEIWIEEVYETKRIDMSACALHEFYECWLMKNKNMSYDDAHDSASKIEKLFRTWVQKYEDTLTSLQMVKSAEILVKAKINKKEK